MEQLDATEGGRVAKSLDIGVGGVLVEFEVHES